MDQRRLKFCTASNQSRGDAPEVLGKRPLFWLLPFNGNESSGLEWGLVVRDSGGGLILLCWRLKFEKKCRKVGGCKCFSDLYILTCFNTIFSWFLLINYILDRYVFSCAVERPDCLALPDDRTSFWKAIDPYINTTNWL